MKKTIVTVAIALISIASASAVDIVVKKAIVVGGGTNATTFNGPTQSTAVIGQSGCSSVTSFQAGIQLEFQVSGTPVNVSDFHMTVGTFSLRKNGATVWNATPFGAYHAIGSGSPDYIVYTANGTDVSPTGVNKWVSDWNLDGSGIHIPSMSKFQLVSHPIPTSLSAAGDYYELWYDIACTYTYGGTAYSNTLTVTNTAIDLMVTNDVPGFTNVTNAPSKITLQVSDNLQNWVTTNVVVPYPRPSVPLNVIALMPSTSNVPGLVNTRRYYRFCQTIIP